MLPENGPDVFRTTPSFLIVEIGEKDSNRRRNDLQGLRLRTIFYSSPGAAAAAV